MGQRSIATIAAQLEASEYDAGYIAYVVLIVESQFRKGKIKKPAGAIYKALVEKYLLDDYKHASVAKPVVKKQLPTGVQTQPKVAFKLNDVREMYDKPGPYALRRPRAATFEEHLQQVYLNDGFVLEIREGIHWIVKR